MDVLRLWVASTDFASDVALGPSIMASVSEALRKVRNTCRFLLGAGQPLGAGAGATPAQASGGKGWFGSDVDALTRLWSRCAVEGPSQGAGGVPLTELDK